MEENTQHPTNHYHRKLHRLNRFTQMFVVVGIFGIVASSLLALSHASTVPKGTANDSLGCSQIVGWAFDPDKSSQSIQVDIYFTPNSSPKAGVDPGVHIATNVYRSDVNAAYKITGNHGFKYIVPNKVQGITVRNNATWNVFAYAIGVSSSGTADGQNPLIGTGKIQCTATSGASGLTAKTASSSQINLSWSAAKPGTGLSITKYQVYRNGSLAATTTGTTFSDTGRAASTNYSYYIKTTDSSGQSFNTSTVSAKTLSKPSPPPPSSGGGTGGGSTVGGSSGGNSYSGGNSRGSSSGASRPAVDKTPPSAPENFMATANNDNKSVMLEWSSATDNVGVTGYVIDHSTDNKNWTNINNNIVDITYEDYSPEFGQTNYYRIAAQDAVGNKSIFVYASAQASDFETNVSKDQDSLITSEDGVVEVFFPAGSLEQDLFCTWVTPDDILGAAVNNYRQIAGPYQLSCRNAASELVNPLNDNVSDATIHTDKVANGQKLKLVYFGQGEDSKWEQLNKTKVDKKAKTETINLSGKTIFAIMTPVKKTSIWVTIITILLVILGIGLAVLLFLRFRLRRQLQNKYDDYLHQSRGF